MYEKVKTAYIPNRDRVEYFTNLISDSFFQMTCAPKTPAQFECEIEQNQVGAVRLANIASSPLVVSRSKKDLVKSGDAFYLVKFQMAGRSCFKQRNREACLQPGDFVLCSSTEPYELYFEEAHRQVVLSVPQPLLHDCVQNPDQFLALRMQPDLVVNSLLSQFVLSLGQKLQDLDANIAGRLEANVLDLLATAFDHTRQQSLESGTNDGVRTEHIYRIKQFIRKHLNEPRLSPEQIAKAHHISTRYLHMLFQQENYSVSKYIQHQRLEACRENLANRELAHFSASEIAFRWGFNDASHFNRLFKQAFGTTPMKYRKLAG